MNKIAFDHFTGGHIGFTVKDSEESVDGDAADFINFIIYTGEFRCGHFTDRRVVITDYIKVFGNPEAFFQCIFRFV